MAFDFNRKIAVSKEVLFRDLGAEAVILDLKGQYYYGLDDVGTRVWQLIEECETLASVADRLLREYDVDASELHTDLDRIATELLDAGLLVFKGEESPV